MYTRCPPNVNPNMTPDPQLALHFEKPGTAPKQDRAFRTSVVRVSSSQRNLMLHPRASDFEVRLPKAISNIYSARVLQCNLPYIVPVTTSSLVYVRVNQFNNISDTDGTQHYTSVSFPEQTGTTGFAHLNTTALSGVSLDHTFPRQLSRADRFRIELFDHTGSPLGLPVESSIGANQVTMVIELTHLEPCTDILGA